MCCYSQDTFCYIFRSPNSYQTFFRRRIKTLCIHTSLHPLRLSPSDPEQQQTFVLGGRVFWPAVGDLRGSGLSEAPVGRLGHLDVLLNVRVVRLRATWLYLRDDRAIARCQPGPEKGKFVINLLLAEEEKKSVILRSDGRQVPVLKRRQRQKGCCYFFLSLTSSS